MFCLAEMGNISSTFSNGLHIDSSGPSSDEDDSISSNNDDSNNYCFDSDTVDARPQLRATSSPITLNQVNDIEQMLDIYEKVSVIYLLYEDPLLALDHLTKLITGSNERLIFQWARNEQSTLNWQMKLIEAICIIQNYEILRHFDFNKQDLIDRFLPHYEFASESINKVRKAQYLICENFGQNNVKQFLSLACADFNKRNLCFEVFNPIYLELYFLHWETIGYIKQNNLSNLCAILKQMDQLDLCEKLKKLVPVESGVEINETQNEVKKSKSIFDAILDKTASLSTLVTHESILSVDNVSANKYHVDENNPGVCLIINQENFYTAVDKNLQHLLPASKAKLESRTGTSFDKEKLMKTFKHFGFTVRVVDNLDHSEIMTNIEDVVNSIRNESSLVVCIMSHGDEGIIYGVNSCRVSVKNIKNIMCSKNRENLSGKPKVLILQSCQGTRCQKIFADSDDFTTDGPASLPLGVPPCADLLTFWATVPGFGAIRNKKTGSWFIQSLCDKMLTLATKYHFEEICTYVINDVSGKKWCQVNDEVAMVPLKDSTLRKAFFLPLAKSNV